MGKGKRKKKKQKQPDQGQQQQQQQQQKVQEKESAAAERSGASLIAWSMLGWIRPVNFSEWAHKHQRGLYVRWCSVGILFTLVVYGLRSLFIAVPSNRWWRQAAVSMPNPLWEDQLVLPNGFLVSIGIAGLLACGLMVLFFRHLRVSEFMIDTETEMRKVSWPSWEQLKTSTVATVVAVFLLGVYLYVVDILLAGLFDLAFWSS